VLASGRGARHVLALARHGVRREAAALSDGPAISVRGLRKSYGSLEAVKGIDLEIARGEVFALLGPNGAGKTTTVEILEGFRTRDGGEVSVLGHDPATGDRDMKERIGIVLQSTGIDPYLTVAETVDLYSGYYPAPRPAGEVIDVVGLTAKADTRVIKLSGGQQRRLDVAIALAGDPELLFLDEPTTGFDPSARRGAWEIVKNLAALGKTVLLTTHYMDEAQYLADRVAVIAAGVIVAEGPPSTIGGRDHARTRIRFRLPEGTPAPSIDGVEATASDDAVEMVAADPTRALHALTGWALERNVELSGLEVRRPSLEDAYLELTGGPTTEEPAEPEPAGRGRRRRRS
jgi:ABC-2 type transport system ATP-binding protein